MKGTSSTPIPDLVTDSYPLDNSTTTDLLEHQRPRTDSALFTQFVSSRNPPSRSNNHHHLPSNNAVRRTHDQHETWREVNGDWRHLGIPLNANDVGNHGDALWLDADQMDVPLLNTGMDADPPGYAREMESWDHCHLRTSTANPSQITARNQLIAASALCLVFMIAEAVGGYLSNSLAVMTDAAHMLSDFTSFLVSLFAIWISGRPASRKMSFGYHRAEILGALFSVLIIWILTGILVYLAIERIVRQDYDIDADSMIIISGIGVAMNLMMGAVLHGGMCSKLNLVHHGHSHGGSGGGHSHGGSRGGHGHSHSPGQQHHGHSHGHSRNMNVRAALIHVIGDLVQSIGVLIAAIVIKYQPSFRLADPICTFLFSGLVLATTVGLIRDGVRILMEGVPSSVDYSVLRRDLKSIDGVRSVHSLHVWSLTLDKNAIAAHLAIGAMADYEKVLNSATKLLQSKYGMNHCTVQVERYNASTMEICPQCLALHDD